MGMRGRWAVPLVSMWRVPPKPPRKRRCRRCDKLFSPKRHDAVFCSGRCRVAVFRKRVAADAKTDGRLIFSVSFRPDRDDIDGERAFKALLKSALQKYGLRVVSKEQSQDAA
jgi:hypothetical protein